MLGRHVYRVKPNEAGGWVVGKEGEAAERTLPSRDAAIAHAVARAERDEPSKVIVEGEHGVIDDEKVFGVDSGLIEAPQPPLQN